MFSGIVQYLEPVKKINHRAGNILVYINKPKNLKCNIGDSICVDGVCSTVIKKTAGFFQVEYMPETLKRTTLAKLKENQKVNLEPSLKLNDIVAGHLVAGHIDCVGEIISIKIRPDISIQIKYPKKYCKYLIEKGSIAINGVGLTCFNLKKYNFTVCLIPHTIKTTNLQNLSIVDKVNLEFDLIGKYVEKFTRN